MAVCHSSWDIYSDGMYLRGSCVGERFGACMCVALLTTHQTHQPHNVQNVNHPTQPPATQLPIHIQATVTSGTLHMLNDALQVPLAFIRGTGEVSLVYVDRDMRVFRQGNGSLAVQVNRALLE